MTGAHRQWRAVGIDRGPEGDDLAPGEWRDDRSLAARDLGNLEASYPPFDECVIETQFLSEIAVERAPFIPREAPKPAPERMAYIGTGPCGCVTFAMVIGVDTAAQEAKELAQVVRTGRVIDRVTVDEARTRLTFDCAHAEAA
jgi:hypothetical protein